MISKMRGPKDGGSRIGIVFNGSPLFTGDAEGGESNIRRWIIENDWLEAIVALPDQLFYNTGISTYIWILTNRKEKRRKGKIQLIDAREFYVKMRKSLGNKRNQIGDGDEGRPNQISEITEIYGNFKHDETRTITIGGVRKTVIASKIFDNADFGYNKITIERPLRLNFQASDTRITLVEEQKAFKDLASSDKKNETVRQQEIEAGKERQGEIRILIGRLKEETGGTLFKNRAQFLEKLRQAEHGLDMRLSAPEIKLIIEALSERDESADICADKNGKPEPDSELRDTENVPLKENIEDYFKRDVLPHVPDAWIDEAKTKVGYEIPINRHFYCYELPRRLETIEADIKGLETEIVSLLGQVTGSSEGLK
jgi:type I restriction enzyme M protein